MSPISKVCFSLAVTVLFSCTALAQKPWNLKWGAPHKPEYPGSIRGIVHSGQQGYYALRCKIPELRLSNKPHKAALELYDKKLNFVKSEALELEYNGQSLEFAGFVPLGDKHFLLTSYHNAKQEKKYLFARAVNMQSLKCEGDYTKIMEMPVSSKLRYPYFDFKSSPDSSLLLVYGTLNFQDGKKESFSLAVMDANMKVLWAKDLELPYGQKEAKVNAYSVDNQANVYLLVARDHAKNEKKVSKDVNKYYSVFTCRDSGTNVKEYEASLGEQYITDIGFETLQSGDLLCVGFYSDKGMRGLYSGAERIKGVFSYKFKGQDGKEYEKSTQEFSLDIRTSDLSSRRQDKVKDNEGESGHELKGYELRLLSVQGDGSFFLIGEKHYEETGSTSQGGRKYSISHQDDLLVVKLDAKGQMIWTCKVDKEQKGMGGYQFAFIPTPEKQYFFYKNGYGRSDKMNLATVSSDGKVSSSLFDVEDVEVQNSTRLALSSNTVIVWSSSDSKSRIGKIVFP